MIYIYDDNKHIYKNHLFLFLTISDIFLTRLFYCPKLMTFY